MSNSHSTNRAQDSGSSLLLRLYWMWMGPILVVLLLLMIANRGSGWLTGVDIAYLVVMFALPLARLLDFRTGSALTAEGQPATWNQVQHYVIAAPIVGLIAWVVANVIGNHVISR